jgi:predicted ABC-type ATPase
LPDRPTLHLIGGINGAGKTTFYYQFLKSRTPGLEYVNADEIERARWPHQIGLHSYEAGELAADRREALLVAGRSFVAETVFSHASKLQLVEHARALGFRVVLYHIHVCTPELAVARVATRVSQGGHAVSADTIRVRHPRTLVLLKRAGELADRSFVFDNSRLGRGFTHVLTLEEGKIRRLGSYVPDWVKREFRERLTDYLESRRIR